jgi:hypothetical protein
MAIAQMGNGEMRDALSGELSRRGKGQSQARSFGKATSVRFV